MRKALNYLPIVILAALLLPNAAHATPVVTIKGEPVPIPGFPHTGNILGAGTAAQVTITIEGNEYFGSPPPVIGLNAFLPSGVKLHPQGFPTCTASTLEAVGPSGCPKGSAAGPVGSVVGFVTFGGERVEETAEIFCFYKVGGGATFLTDGHSPVSLEIPSNGHIANLDDSGGTGPELLVEVPLVASLPGAPYASVRSIKATVGSAYSSHGHTSYYARLPGRCPKGGWRTRYEVIFAENGEPSKPEIVGGSTIAPCPKGSASRAS
jgi:hypothetical protein